MKNKNILTIVLMMIILCFVGSNYTIINSTIIQIEKGFNVNDTDIGMMGSMLMLVSMLVGIVWGRLVDKNSRKMLFIYSIIITQVPTFLVIFAANYTQFFVLRILAEIGRGAAFSTLFPLLGDICDEKKRNVYVTWAVAAIAFGQILSYVFAGYLGLLFGWKVLYAVIGLLGIILLPFFYVLLPGAKKEESAGTVKIVEDTESINFLSVIKKKTNSLTLLQSFIGNIAFGAMELFGLKFFFANKGLTLKEATIVCILSGFGSILGMTIGGIWGNKLFAKKPKYLPRFCAITLLAAFFIAIFVVLMPFRNGLITISILMFISNFLGYTRISNTKIILMETTPPKIRGKIFSSNFIADSLGIAISRFLGGIFATTFGLTITMILFIMLCLPSVAILFIISFVFENDIQKAGINYEMGG